MLLIVPWFAACASSQPVTPRATTLAQIDALRRGDRVAAARLLTEDARQRAPLWSSVDALPTDASVGEVARVASWDDGARRLKIVRGAEGWQIRVGVLALLRARTPEEAQATFARALVNGDYEAVLRLIPRAQRAAWSAAALRGAMEADPQSPPWEALARAILATPGEARWLNATSVEVRRPAGTLVLSKESDGWKVFDVLPADVYKRP